MTFTAGIWLISETTLGPNRSRDKGVAGARRPCQARIDTPGGLIVPVLRNIESKTLEQLRAEVAAQKQAALQRRTAPEDLRDFTVMLTNFGTLAGRYGVPIVVPPAVAILGAGKVQRRDLTNLAVASLEMGLAVDA